MSEPRTRAKTIQQVVPRVFRWHIKDERIGDTESDAYAVRDGDALVLIDPLPLEFRAEAALARIGRLVAVCLTGSCHQRSAWRYRKKFGSKIYAPREAEGLEGKADAYYEGGESLPGGLTAVHAPGPAEAHYAFLRPRGGVLFCSDLLMNAGRKGLRFVSDEYQDDPARTRESVRKLLDLKFRVLCFAHGAPLTEGARQAIREALRKDAGP